MKRASMATFSHRHSFSSKYGVRSISLPTRSHPTTVKVEEELNKLRSLLLIPSSSTLSKVETICFCLNGLSELYKSIEDVLKLPLTQQALGQHRDENWVNELLDCPIRFLDLLGKSRDSILLMKGVVEDLQSAVRRRKFGMEENQYVSAYWSIRRNMKKECTKFMLLLKHVDESFGSFCNLDLSNHVCAIVRVVREASLVTSSIFESLFVFLSSPILKSRVTTKWEFVSRLVHKGVFACNNQGESVNELEKVDLALCRLLVVENSNMSRDFSADVEKIQSAHTRLESLVESIEGIENGLECLFKHLINTRVCFLNILSPN